MKFCYRDHISEYPQALKIQDDKMIDSDEPACKKPRIYSYPKLLFEKLREMTDPVSKVHVIHCIQYKYIAFDLLLYKIMKKTVLHMFLSFFKKSD